MGKYTWDRYYHVILMSDQRLRALLGEIGLEETLKLTWNMLKYKCDVKKELADLPKVRCHPGQLYQVVMNLLINAAGAAVAAILGYLYVRNDDSRLARRLIETYANRHNN